ncbi:hypothetical protein [Tessaracoccus sp. Z1128]
MSSMSILVSLLALLLPIVGPADAPPRPDAEARDICTVFPWYPGC